MMVRYIHFGNIRYQPLMICDTEIRPLTIMNTPIKNMMVTIVISMI